MPEPDEGVRQQEGGIEYFSRADLYILTGLAEKDQVVVNSHILIVAS